MTSVSGKWLGRLGSGSATSVTAGMPGARRRRGGAGTCAGVSHAPRAPSHPNSWVAEISTSTDCTLIAIRYYYTKRCL